MQLQTILKRPLLELACRHHIPELICGAACKCVYGDTESPDESCFVAFAKAWNGINKESYNLPSITSSYLKTLQSQTTDFLTEFLTSEQATLRHDYKELGTLTFLYLVEHYRVALKHVHLVPIIMLAG